MATADIPMLEDTQLDNSSATTNYYSSGIFNVGESNADASIKRSWIKPDFSTIPTGATFTAASLKLTPIADYTSNVRTMRAHRCLRTVVVEQATWNIYSTGNNWGTAGCSNSTSDYDGAVEIGNMSVPANPTINVQMSMTLDAAELQKLFDGTYTNNGIILFMDTQVSDQTRYGSTQNATSAYRPIISLTYTPAGGSGFFAFF